MYWVHIHYVTCLLHLACAEVSRWNLFSFVSCRRFSCMAVLPWCTFMVNSIFDRLTFKHRYVVRENSFEAGVCSMCGECPSWNSVQFLCRLSWSLVAKSSRATMVWILLQPNRTLEVLCIGTLCLSFQQCHAGGDSALKRHVFLKQKHIIVLKEGVELFANPVNWARGKHSTIDR